MFELTLAKPPLIPIDDAGDTLAPEIIDGEAREIIPATPPRDGSYTFSSRRRIAVVENRW